MPGDSNAVFLSYASEDAEAAERIATALRAAGVEVWFDRSELQGADALDSKIRAQIHSCALFVPIISTNSQARPEGYFRLEWNLAHQRTHLMGRNRAFVMPLCIDATPEREADVPDSFLAVQWMRLSPGATPAAFVARVQRLLSGVTVAMPGGAAVPGVALPRSQTFKSAWPSRAVLMGAAVVIGGVGYMVVERLWTSTPTTSPTVAVKVPAVFAPPPHSIAVLPFVNMSEDKDQEYLSQGLTEELLNSLSRIDQLQVVARTSAFSFQGEHPDITAVAHKLNVGAVLEGSVRRSADTVRITVQLVNGATGFHVWSETYDRNLGDVLKLQTEIATTVASALKVTLLGNEAAKIEIGGSRNAAAFDAYLRAEKAYYTYTNAKAALAAIDAYTQAIAFDRGFALAYAARSIARCNFAKYEARAGAFRDYLDAAKSDADEALALAPELADAHLALAFIDETSLEFTLASQEFRRALAIEPSNARVLWLSGRFAVLMGAGDSGLTAVRRAVLLDPLNANLQESLAFSLFLQRRYDESIEVYENARALAPTDPDIRVSEAFPNYMLGNYQVARSLCEFEPMTDQNYICLALTYKKLGQRTDAETMLAKLHALLGDDGAYLYVDIHAQWDDSVQALHWIEAAMRLRRPWLERVKMNPVLDPIRREPRFQAVMRELNFPD